MSIAAAPSPKRRIVFSNMTRLLAAIVCEIIGRHADLTCVGTVALPDLPLAISSLRPDVVVLAQPRSDRAREARDQLRSAPDLTVVELRPRDDRAVVWRPGSAPEQVELTASGIVAALHEKRQSEEGGTVRSQ